jgi:hypothetical protein
MNCWIHDLSFGMEWRQTIFPSPEMVEWRWEFGTYYNTMWMRTTGIVWVDLFLQLDWISGNSIVEVSYSERQSQSATCNVQLFFKVNGDQFLVKWSIYRATRKNVFLWFGLSLSFPTVVGHVPWFCSLTAVIKTVNCTLNKSWLAKDRKQGASVFGVYCNVMTRRTDAFSSTFYSQERSLTLGFTTFGPVLPIQMTHQQYR